jgi:nucleotide-binding universal stress UspA family protein
MDLHKILVPTDFSPDACAALDLALELSRAKSAKVIAMHVCHVPTYAFFNGGLFAPTRELMDGIILDAMQALQEEKSHRRAQGDTVEIACFEGNPAEVIVRWAASEKADLIVMGTHGRRGLKRLLMGSVAEHVIRTASQPVLIVRAAKEEAAQKSAIANAP